MIGTKVRSMEYTAPVWEVEITISPKYGVPLSRFSPAYPIDGYVICISRTPYLRHV